MKKIIIFLSLFVALFGCKKSSTSCYACHVRANGDDTVICDRPKSDLDALQSSILQGGCVINH